MRNHHEKSTALRPSGFHVFCFDLHSEPQHESGRRLLAVECFPAVSVHAANALASAAPAKGSCRRCETDPLPPGGLAALEHCRLRSVLRTAFHGLLLWGILVRCRHLADYHCGRCAADAPVRQQNSCQKPPVFRGHPGRNLYAPAAPSGKHGILRLAEGAGTDPHCGRMLSSWEPKDDGPLPCRVLHDPARLWNDPVQYALLAAVLRLRVVYPRTSFLRSSRSVCECGTVFWCRSNPAVLRSYESGQAQSKAAGYH